MCGRYATTVDPALLATDLDAIDETDPNEELRPEEAGPNYNVAPTTKVLTVVNRHEHGKSDDTPKLRVRRMRWGLVPRWTKAAEPGVPAKGKPLFNARADKAATTPAFRDALKYKRCLVPMDGWYEWLTGPDADGKAAKIPYFMTPQDGGRIYMAGLWSVWRDPKVPDSTLLSCTILTTDAVGDLQRIHPRMPLVMPERQWAAWLDPDATVGPELLEPPADDVVGGLELRPVSDAVNNVKNNEPQLVERVDVESRPQQISLL